MGFGPAFYLAGFKNYWKIGGPSFFGVFQAKFMAKNPGMNVKSNYFFFFLKHAALDGGIIGYKV